MASIPNHFLRLATPDNTPADRRRHVFTTVSLLFQFSNALGNFEPKLWNFKALFCSPGNASIRVPLPPTLKTPNFPISQLSNFPPRPNRPSRPSRLRRSSHPSQPSRPNHPSHPSRPRRPIGFPTTVDAMFLRPFRISFFQFSNLQFPAY